MILGCLNDYFLHSGYLIVLYFYFYCFYVLIDSEDFFYYIFLYWTLEFTCIFLFYLRVFLFWAYLDLDFYFLI